MSGLLCTTHLGTSYILARWSLPGGYPANLTRHLPGNAKLTTYPEILTILSQSDFQLTRKRCLPGRPDLPGAAANQSSPGKCFPGGSARNTCSAIPGFAYSPDYPDSLLRWQFPTIAQRKTPNSIGRLSLPGISSPDPTLPRRFPGKMSYPASPESLLFRGSPEKLAVQAFSGQQHV